MDFFNEKNVLEFRCNECRFSTLTIGRYMSHIMSYHPKTAILIYQCELCNKVGSPKEYMSLHSLTDHEIEDKFRLLSAFRIGDEAPNFPCVVCSKSFECKSELIVHHRELHQASQREKSSSDASTEVRETLLDSSSVLSQNNNEIRPISNNGDELCDLEIREIELDFDETHNMKLKRELTIDCETDNELSILKVDLSKRDFSKLALISSADLTNRDQFVEMYPTPPPDHHIKEEIFTEVLGPSISECQTLHQKNGTSEEHQTLHTSESQTLRIPDRSSSPQLVWFGRVKDLINSQNRLTETEAASVVTQTLARKHGVDPNDSTLSSTVTNYLNNSINRRKQNLNSANLRSESDNSENSLQKESGTSQLISPVDNLSESQVDNIPAKPSKSAKSNRQSSSSSSSQTSSDKLSRPTKRHKSNSSSRENHRTSSIDSRQTFVSPNQDSAQKVPANSNHLNTSTSSHQGHQGYSPNVFSQQISTNLTCQNNAPNLAQDNARSASSYHHPTSSYGECPSTSNICRSYVAPQTSFTGNIPQTVQQLYYQYVSNPIVSQNSQLQSNNNKLLVNMLQANTPVYQQTFLPTSGQAYASPSQIQQQISPFQTVSNQYQQAAYYGSANNQSQFYGHSNMSQCQTNQQASNNTITQLYHSTQRILNNCSSQKPPNPLLNQSSSNISTLSTSSIPSINQIFPQKEINIPPPPPALNMTQNNHSPQPAISYVGHTVPTQIHRSEGHSNTNHSAPNRNVNHSPGSTYARKVSLKAIHEYLSKKINEGLNSGNVSREVMQRLYGQLVKAQQLMYTGEEFVSFDYSDYNRSSFKKIGLSENNPSHNTTWSYGNGLYQTQQYPVNTTSNAVHLDLTQNYPANTTSNAVYLDLTENYPANTTSNAMHLYKTQQYPANTTSNAVHLDLTQNYPANTTTSAFRFYQDQHLSVNTTISTPPLKQPQHHPVKTTTAASRSKKHKDYPDNTTTTAVSSNKPQNHSISRTTKTLLDTMLQHKPVYKTTSSGAYLNQIQPHHANPTGIACLDLPPRYPASTTTNAAHQGHSQPYPLNATTSAAYQGHSQPHPLNATTSAAYQGHSQPHPLNATTSAPYQGHSQPHPLNATTSAACLDLIQSQPVNATITEAPLNYKQNHSASTIISDVHFDLSQPLYCKKTKSTAQIDSPSSSTASNNTNFTNNLNQEALEVENEGPSLIEKMLLGYESPESKEKKLTLSVIKSSPEKNDCQDEIVNVDIDADDMEVSGCKTINNLITNPLNYNSTNPSVVHTLMKYRLIKLDPVNTTIKQNSFQSSYKTVRRSSEMVDDSAPNPLKRKSDSEILNNSFETKSKSNKLKENGNEETPMGSILEDNSDNLIIDLSPVVIIENIENELSEMEQSSLQPTVDIESQSNQLIVSKTEPENSADENFSVIDMTEERKDEEATSPSKTSKIVLKRRHDNLWDSILCDTNLDHHTQHPNHSDKTDRLRSELGSLSDATIPMTVPEDAGVIDLEADSDSDVEFVGLEKITDKNIFETFSLSCSKFSRTCQICHLEFPNVTSLDNHLWRVHRSAAEKDCIEVQEDRKPVLNPNALKQSLELNQCCICFEKLINSGEFVNHMELLHSSSSSFISTPKKVILHCLPSDLKTQLANAVWPQEGIPPPACFLCPTVVFKTWNFFGQHCQSIHGLNPLVALRMRINSPDDSI